MGRIIAHFRGSPGLAGVGCRGSVDLLQQLFDLAPMIGVARTGERLFEHLAGTLLVADLQIGTGQVEAHVEGVVFIRLADRFRLFGRARKGIHGLSTLSWSSSSVRMLGISSSAARRSSLALCASHASASLPSSATQEAMSSSLKSELPDGTTGLRLVCVVHQLIQQTSLTSSSIASSARLAVVETSSSGSSSSISCGAFRRLLFGQPAEVLFGFPQACARRSLTGASIRSSAAGANVGQLRNGRIFSDCAWPTYQHEQGHQTQKAKNQPDRPEILFVPGPRLFRGGVRWVVVRSA